LTKNIDDSQLRLLNRHLDSLNSSLQNCISTQDWAALAEMDKKVSRLVRAAIDSGGLEHASIYRKVLAIKRMYENILSRLNQERQGIHQEMTHAKQVNNAQRVYLAQANG
jgi:hypothetical protein